MAYGVGVWLEDRSLVVIGGSNDGQDVHEDLHDVQVEIQSCEEGFI